MTEKVLISGAGVAGLALGYWLRRRGFPATVVERAPDLRAGGYKVDVRGAALQVVERMGLLPRIRERATEVRSATIVTADGRRAAAMDGDTFGGRAHGDAEISRGDLVRLLFEACREAGVEFRFGDSIDALAPDADGVDVTFAGGGTGRYGLVVGADGMRSRTRALAFGPHERFVRDLGYRVSVYSVPNDLGLDREEVTYAAPGRTALAYNTANDPDARALFLFSADGPVPADQREQRRQLAEAYAGEGWEVPRLLAGADAAPDFYFDSISQVHLDRWSAGRVALLGDAAYCASPASGQGTSLALVGAYVLAGELASAPGEHGAALAEYEAQMRPFVAKNQALGPANIKRMVMASRRQLNTGLVMLRVLNRLPFKDRLMAKVIEPIHRAATAITLKTYQ